MPEPNIEPQVLDYFSGRVNYWIDYYKEHPEEAEGAFDAAPEDVHGTIDAERAKYGVSRNIMVAGMTKAFLEWEDTKTKNK